MKQKDIALIIMVAFISVVASYFISNAVVGTPQANGLKAETVEAISGEFSELPEKYFNEKSKNPTRIIEITNPENPSPFDDTSE